MLCSVSCVSHYYVVLVLWAGHIKKKGYWMLWRLRGVRESVGEFLATELMGASGYLLPFEADSSFINSYRRNLF